MVGDEGLFHLTMRDSANLVALSDRGERVV